MKTIENKKLKQLVEEFKRTVDEPNFALTEAGGIFLSNNNSIKGFIGNDETFNGRYYTNEESAILATLVSNSDEDLSYDDEKNMSLGSVDLKDFLSNSLKSDFYKESFSNVKNTLTNPLITMTKEEFNKNFFPEMFRISGMNAYVSDEIDGAFILLKEGKLYIVSKGFACVYKHEVEGLTNKTTLNSFSHTSVIYTITENEYNIIKEKEKVEIEVSQENIVIKADDFFLMKENVKAISSLTTMKFIDAAIAGINKEGHHMVDFNAEALYDGLKLFKNNGLNINIDTSIEFKNDGVKIGKITIPVEKISIVNDLKFSTLIDGFLTLIESCSGDCSVYLEENFLVFKNGEKNFVIRYFEPEESDES